VTFSRRRDLPFIAPTLNNAGFLATASDDMIRHTLRHGREGTPMRYFK
jgi:cytochrome c oxidase cbb3-type subunit 3